MLRVKTSDSILAVSMSDPALMDVSLERMRAYESSRNLDDLGPLDKLKEQPTIWELDSLDARFENFLDSASSDDLWFIFKHNARPKGELLDDSGNQVLVPKEELNGKTVLDDDARKMIGRAPRHELAHVMIQRCNGRNGVDVPFVALQPGSWLAEVTQSRIHLARQEALARLNASGKKTVEPTVSKPEADPTED